MFLRACALRLARLALRASLKRWLRALTLGETGCFAMALCGKALLACQALRVALPLALWHVTATLASKLP